MTEFGVVKQLLQATFDDLRAALSAFAGIRPESWLLAGLCAALLALWIWGASLLPPAVFPSPEETGQALFWMLMDVRQDYVRGIGASLSVYFTGLLLALAFGWMLIFLMGIQPLLGRVIGPCLDFLGSIPNIALMPMIVALLGLGPPAKIVVIFLAAVLPIVINGFAALRQVDRGVEEAAYVLGANRIQTHWQVIWPLALPQMVAGLRIGAAQGLVATVIAEIYTAMTGLGGLLVGYGSSFNMPRYFVVVITLAVIGVVTTGLLRAIERILVRRAHLIDKGN